MGAATEARQPVGGHGQLRSLERAGAEAEHGLLKAPQERVLRCPRRVVGRVVGGGGGVVCRGQEEAPELGEAVGQVGDVLRLWSMGCCKA